MGLTTNWVIFVLVVINLARIALAQEPFSLPIKGESCNMIHVSCGGGQLPTSGQAEPRNPGPPGKMGPVGPIGPQGSKGDSGDQGLKGTSGRDADAKEITDDVLKMISVTSCKELNSKHGVNKTGYYLMRTNGSDASRYRHCHFGLYEDVFTCHELQESNGISESGHYIMGTRNKPYEVYCEFYGGSASTQVWHDTMEEIKIPVACEVNGCYSKIPAYEVDQDNMIKIIEKSEHCRQFIKFRCQGAVLLTNNNNPYGWWVSRQGEKMLYWGSSQRKPGYCGCGVTGKCVDPTKKCNCDINSGTIITQDEGFLTDKAKLPVREMRFGDMGDAGEIGWHELGYLECAGQG